MTIVCVCGCVATIAIVFPFCILNYSEHCRNRNLENKRQTRQKKIFMPPTTLLPTTNTQVLCIYPMSCLSVFCFDAYSDAYKNEKWISCTVQWHHHLKYQVSHFLPGILSLHSFFYELFSSGCVRHKQINKTTGFS